MNCDLIALSYIFSAQAVQSGLHQDVSIRGTQPYMAWPLCREHCGVHPPRGAIKTIWSDDDGRDMQGVLDNVDDDGETADQEDIGDLDDGGG